MLPAGSPFMMTSLPDTRTIPSLGLLSLFIAPPVLISGAFTSLLGSDPVPVRYICGSFPVILPCILAHNRTIRITRITEADQIIPTIIKSQEPYILVEHDAVFYDTNADLIRPIGLACRRKVAEHQHSIFMLAPRTDGWLKRFEPFVHRIQYQNDLTRSLVPPGRPLSCHLPLL